jgi:hypothetical protein
MKTFFLLLLSACCLYSQKGATIGSADVSKALVTDVKTNEMARSTTNPKTSETWSWQEPPHVFRPMKDTLLRDIFRGDTCILIFIRNKDTTLISAYRVLNDPVDTCNVTTARILINYEDRQK